VDSLHEVLLNARLIASFILFHCVQRSGAASEGATSMPVMDAEGAAM